MIFSSNFAILVFSTILIYFLQLNFRLLRLSESTFSNQTQSLPPVLHTLQEHVIRDCVVGPDHLAFLLDDGRVCRVAYSAALKSISKLNDEPNKEKSKSSKHLTCM